MGDWEIPKQLRNYISTPNIRLKRLLGKHFTVYNLDECRTSCINYKTETECENLKVKDKTGKLRSLHSVLTYQTESKRLGCINRDKNAVNNFEKIIKSWLECRQRPKIYTREKSLTSKAKSSKTIKVKSSNMSNSDKPKQARLLLVKGKKIQNKNANTSKKSKTKYQK
jgi:hypothetical protein